MASLPQPTPRVALYARVSSEDQAERGTIGAQLDFLRKYADLMGLPVAGEYVDDGVSGTLALAKRPEGQRLLRDGEAGIYGVVLMVRVDRLARSLDVLVDAHAQLEQRSLAIRSATEPFDTTTPQGTFMFQLLGSIAELNRATLLENMGLGRDRVARGGKWPGGALPVGYVLDARGDLLTNADPIEHLGTSMAGLVAELFERIAGGSTLIAEAQRWTVLGVPNVRRYSSRTRATAKVTHGGDRWNPSTLGYLIRNTVYKGSARLNSQRGLIEYAAPPIVSPELWEAANRRILVNRSMSKKNAKRDYLLRGLIVCADCGLRFSGHPNRVRGRMFYYYKCSSQNPSNTAMPADRCNAKLLNADWLEDLVWQDCREFAHHPGPALDEARRQLRARLAQAAGLEGERLQLQRALADKEGERERVMTLYRRGRATLEDTEGQLDAIQREATDLRAQLDVIRGHDELTQAAESRYAQASALLAGLRERVEEIDRGDDRQTKREAIELLVSHVRVQTSGTGHAKSAHLKIRYTFAPERIVDGMLGSSTQDQLQIYAAHAHDHAAQIQRVRAALGR